MPKQHLTKEQIRRASGMKLSGRLNYLHAKINDQHRDAGVSMTDIREAHAIVKELKGRLKKIWQVFFKGEVNE